MDLGIFFQKNFQYDPPPTIIEYLKKVQNTDAKSEIFQSRGGFVELFRVGEVSWN